MKKILIVDDEAEIVEFLGNFLKRKGAHVFIATNGTEALEIFRNNNPDLVLLDIVMPEGEEEGIRVLQEIKKSNPKAQVVMITAVGQNAIIEGCKKLGVKDYIVKPFDENQVIETVDKYLS